MDAVGVTDPARCVFVGDRLFDDICGAQQRRACGRSTSRTAPSRRQIGHTEGEPDAVVHSLAEIHGLVRRLVLTVQLLQVCAMRELQRSMARGIAGLCSG